MSKNDADQSQEDLQKEVEQLRAKVASFEKSKEKATKTRLFVAKKLGGFFLLGPQLKESLIKIIEGDLSKDNIAEVLIAVLYRFTRIGTFAILIAMVPIGILTIQTILLSRQNTKIDKQNIRLDQQTALLEADRRSAVILESGNVLDAIARELENKELEKDRTLSDPLIGRIIALSRVFKPYKFLDPEADTLTTVALSPERGHLLISLINSKLDSTTQDKIISRSDFSKADLKGVNLMNANLSGVNLRGADLQEALLRGTQLRQADLQGANLKKTDFWGAELFGVELQNANLFQTIFWGANLKKAELQGATIQEVLLWEANLSGANLSGINFKGSNLEGADLKGADLNGTIFRGSTVYPAQIQEYIDLKIDTAGIIWKDTVKWKIKFY